MKRILIGIITLIGVGLSFCNADVWKIQDYYPDVTCRRNSSTISSYNSNTGFILSVKDTPVIIDYLCVSNDPAFTVGNGNQPQNYTYLNYSLDDGQTYTLSNRFQDYGSSGWCVSFGDNGLLLNVGDTMKYKFQAGFDAICNYCCVYRPVQINGQDLLGTYYIGNFLSTITYYGYPAYIPFSSIYYRQLSPKFKVNYGNTSYEYTLEDNLSIYLKSPVIQSGNIFTYNGSTGINLFYNGTSQWYNKSNLYLDSMFWYNNNIFTSICL